MFGATVTVLCNIANDHSVSKYSRGDASGALRIIVTFDFVFILHLMEKIMKITGVLCQSLQKKNIDIFNAVDSVSTTKVLLDELRIMAGKLFLRRSECFVERTRLIFRI
jgi:hypothetical protein